MNDVMINGYFCQVWKLFKIQMEKIYNEESVILSDFVYISLLVDFATRRDLRLAGQFYTSVSWFLSLQCLNITVDAHATHNNNLLIYYQKEWRKFRIKSFKLSGVCCLLNTRWVQHQYGNQQVADQECNIYNMFQLPLVTWKKMVYKLLPMKLTDLIIEQINAERSGTLINTQLLSNVLRSYIDLGFQKDDNGIMVPSMNFYITEFEEPFLLDTEMFYTEERAQFLMEDNRAGFEERMIQREIEERTRAEAYIPIESLNKVLAILAKVKNQ